MPKKNKRGIKKETSAPRGKDQKSITRPKEPELPQKFTWIQPPNDQWLGWLCFAGIIVLSFLISFHTLVDTDIFWHLKTGQIIWQTRNVPDQDLYSFTRAGKEWIDSQWLFQAILYLLYSKTGYTGMILFGASAAALTWGLILALAFNPKKYFGISLLALIALFSSSIRLKLRPEILTFLYLVLEIILIDQIKRGKKIALILTPALFLFWVNSEGLWPIYFVILAVFLAEEIIFIIRPGMGKDRRGNYPAASRTALWLVIILACSAGLAFLNPNGYRGVIFPAVLFREVAHPGSFLGQIINEFQSPFTHLPMLDLAAYITLMLLSALFFAGLFYRRQFHPASFLLWSGFIFLSITALRNVALFAIITITLIGRILRENKNQELFPFPALKQRFFRLRPFAGMAVLAVIIWLMVDVVSNRFYLRNRTHAQFGVGALETEYPIRAVQVLKSACESMGGRVNLKIFPDAETSAYLIWTGYPEWKVYVDPRLEVYGDKFFEHYMDALENWRDFEREDEEWDFDAVALSYFLSLRPLFMDLYRAPKWALLYFDGHSAIFLKKKPEFSAGIQKFQIDFSQGFSSPLPAKAGPVLLGRERYNRGTLLLMMDQPEYARVEFEAGLKLDPENVDVNYYLGTTLNQLLRYEEALPYLEKVAAQRPDFPQNQIQLARALASTAKTDRAIQIFQGILNQFPNQIYVCIDLAKVYEMISDNERAYAQWKRCEEISRLDTLGFKPQADEISQALKRLTAPNQGPAPAFRIGE